MSGLYDRFKQGLMDEEHDMLADSILIALVDLSDLGTGVSIVTASNATPIVVTTTGAHGLTTGDHVTISGVATNTNANAYWEIIVLSTTTFSLNGSTPNGAGTGGFAVDLTNDTIWTDVSAGLVDTAETIVTDANSIDNGVFNDDGTNVTFTAVTGDECESLMIYNDTPTTPLADPLVACIDDATGLPVTPNSGDITVTFAATGIFAL